MGGAEVGALLGPAEVTFGALLGLAVGAAVTFGALLGLAVGAAVEATGGTVAFEPLPLALAGADVGEADGPLLLLLPPLEL